MLKVSLCYSINAMAKAVKTKRASLNKKDIENKKQIAYLLFMSGEEQKDIAEQVGVTPKTISEWSKAGAWRNKRAATEISRPELTNKILVSVSKILDKAIAEDKYDSIADPLIKLGGMIDKLEKKGNVVQCQEVFMLFNKHLLVAMQSNPAITTETVRTINKLQNDYITLRMSQG